MSDFSEHPLLSLPKFGGRTGLHRAESLIATLGLTSYLATTPRIAIAGTNGKGSTAKFAAEILRRTGRRTGLFTSPHLYRFNERIEIDGGPASDEILADSADAVLATIRDYERCYPGEVVGAFEAFFVLALKVFAEQGVDALVLEAGIGGRFDPVRLARAPFAAVVSIDFDHCELLGNTLIEIAANKVEVATSGGIVVLGPSLTPFAAPLRTHASLLGATALPLGEVSKIIAGQGKTTVAGLRLSLAGRHQLDNFAIAALLARHLLEAEGMPDGEGFARAVREAASETYWPGRLERVLRSPSVTIDVGHSPAAVQAAREAFAAQHKLADCLLVVGCSRDKDAAGMVGILAPDFPRILCTSAHHKGAPATEIAAVAQAVNPTARVEAVEPVEAAAARAIEICRSEGRAAYVAGGLFLAIEFAHSLRGSDPSKLRFF